MKIQKYWIDLFYSLTEDDLKMKPTEIKELKRMDVIEFYQYMNSYNERLDRKIAQNQQQH